jgi:hypothetical protein
MNAQLMAKPIGPAGVARQVVGDPSAERRQALSPRACVAAAPNVCRDVESVGEFGAIRF